MINKKVVVIDYGMGNIWSVVSALKYLGYQAVVSADISEIRTSDSLVLPGVGSFRKAMNSLRKLELDKVIIEEVMESNKLFLGICLGMQLMGISSDEDGETFGLGIIPNKVEKFSQQVLGVNKIPHICFNSVNFSSTSVLFKDISVNSDFYFVHSYRMLPEVLTGGIATCEYGINFLAAYENNNIFATQFHPEKSQTNGLLLLKNFLSL